MRLLTVDKRLLVNCLATPMWFLLMSRVETDLEDPQDRFLLPLGSAANRWCTLLGRNEPTWRIVVAHLVHTGDNLGRTPGRERRRSLAPVDTLPCPSAESPRCGITHAALRTSDSYEMLIKNDHMANLGLQGIRADDLRIVLDRDCRNASRLLPRLCLYWLGPTTRKCTGVHRGTGAPSAEGT